MTGILTQRGVRVTARKRTESDLAGSDHCCVDFGAELTREEIRFVYHLRTAPQCSCCGGYSIEEAYPAAESMREQEDFKVWRMADRARELLH